MDERFYFPCPLRKNRSRVPVTVCHSNKCMYLESDGGKLKCGYGDQKHVIKKRPPVSRISRDGLS